MTKHSLHGAAGTDGLARAFEQAVQVSLTMQQAARRGHRPLIPALSGCRTCRTVRMITSPVLGFCQTCGVKLTVLSSTAWGDAQGAALTGAKEAR